MSHRSKVNLRPKVHTRTRVAAWFVSCTRRFNNRFTAVFAAVAAVALAALFVTVGTPAAASQVVADPTVTVDRLNTCAGIEGITVFSTYAAGTTTIVVQAGANGGTKLTEGELTHGGTVSLSFAPQEAIYVFSTDGSLPGNPYAWEKPSGCDDGSTDPSTSSSPSSDPSSTPPVECKEGEQLNENGKCVPCPTTETSVPTTPDTSTPPSTSTPDTSTPTSSSPSTSASSTDNPSTPASPTPQPPATVTQTATATATVIEPGPQGPQGPAGPAGPQGPQGDQGAPAPAPNTVVVAAPVADNAQPAPQVDYQANVGPDAHTSFDGDLSHGNNVNWGLVGAGLLTLFFGIGLIVRRRVRA